MITRLINNGLFREMPSYFWLFDIMLRSSHCCKYNIIVPINIVQKNNINIIYCKWKKILSIYLLKNGQQYLDNTILSIIRNHFLMFIELD